MTLTEQILVNQAQCAPYLQGREHNVPDHITRQIQKHVADKTGLPVQDGDLWVHESEEDLSFGAVTRRGITAFERYTEGMQAGEWEFDAFDRILNSKPT